MKIRIDNTIITPGFVRKERDVLQKVGLAGHEYEPGTSVVVDSLLDFEAQARGYKDYADMVAKDIC